jgi:hypothetical protein
MAIGTDYNYTLPNQINQQGSDRALVIEEYTGMVEGTIERLSIMQNIVPVRTIRGTDTFTNRAVGKSTLQKVSRGVTPESTSTDFGRNAVTVDTMVLARESFTHLDEFLTNIDVRRELATEQGKEISKFWDQTFAIQALKAAVLTESTFRGAGASGKPEGHFGGSQQVLASAIDLSDPALLYEAIGELFVKMKKKDVNPRMDDVILVVRPEEYFTLSQSELLINQDYVTSTGNQINGASVLKAYGVPVFEHNSVPLLQTVTGHLYSNAANGNAYDGNFSKSAVLAFSPRAIMAGSAVPLTNKVWYDDKDLTNYVDSFLSFAVGPNRAEYAGAVLLP